MLVQVPVFIAGADGNRIIGAADGVSLIPACGAGAGVSLTRHLGVCSRERRDKNGSLIFLSLCSLIVPPKL